MAGLKRQGGAAHPGNAPEGAAPRPATRSAREALYEELFKNCGRAGFIQAARRLCLGDLYFLLTRVLGRADIRRDWLHDRCLEVQDSPDAHLDLWAREHYKSTIITFGKTIQDILSDPEVTVGIFSFNRPVAKAFLRQIKREFESNETLKELFPDVLWENPQKESPKWSEDEGIIVKRKGNPKEATVEAWGLVDGQPTSKHYGLVVYDDVVTRESVTSPDMIAKVTEAWELSLNLGAAGGRVRYIGTRYHGSDTYRTIMEREAAAPRVYPATADGKVDGEPALMTPEVLAKKRREMGPYTFGCQMLQDPRADEAQGFKEEWLRFYEPGPLDNLNLYVLVDPAGEKKRGSDYSVFLVVGLGADENYYLVDMVRDRLNLTERGAALMRLHRTYRPRGVGYEKYGIMADIEFVQTLQARENYRFDITPLGGPVAKNDRIRKLIPVFEQGRMYLPKTLTYVDSQRRTRDLTRDFIDQEYRVFPVSAHDDMLDCLARVLEQDLGAVFPKAGPARISLEKYRPTGTPT
jgi:predicted phage terminase large subunit-like protein